MVQHDCRYQKHISAASISCNDQPQACEDRCVPVCTYLLFGDEVLDDDVGHGVPVSVSILIQPVHGTEVSAEHACMIVCVYVRACVGR